MELRGKGFSPCSIRRLSFPSPALPAHGEGGFLATLAVQWLAHCALVGAVSLVTKISRGSPHTAAGSCAPSHLFHFARSLARLAAVGPTMRSDRLSRGLESAALSGQMIPPGNRAD